MLQHLEDPAFHYFQYHHLNLVKDLLTIDWWMIQGGQDMEAMHKWLEAIELLELDLKACRDLLLLAQQGSVGRAHANKILWELLTGTGADGKYRECSRFCSSQVHNARRQIDRPPRGHPDLEDWTWENYYGLPEHMVRWCSSQVPPQEVAKDMRVNMGAPGDFPLKPPDCWTGKDWKPSS